MRLARSRVFSDADRTRWIAHGRRAPVNIRRPPAWTSYILMAIIGRDQGDGAEACIPATAFCPENHEIARRWKKPGVAFGRGARECHRGGMGDSHLEETCAGRRGVDRSPLGWDLIEDTGSALENLNQIGYPLYDPGQRGRNGGKGHAIAWTDTEDERGLFRRPRPGVKWSFGRRPASASEIRYPARGTSRSRVLADGSIGNWRLPGTRAGMLGSQGPQPEVIGRGASPISTGDAAARWANGCSAGAGGGDTPARHGRVLVGRASGIVLLELNTRLRMENRSGLVHRVDLGWSR